MQFYNPYEKALENVCIASIFLSSQVKSVVSAKDHQGNTALHLAVRHRNWHLVDVLLQHGSCINLTDSDQQTPLHIAATKADVPDYIFAMLNLSRDLLGQ